MGEEIQSGAFISWFSLTIFSKSNEVISVMLKMFSECFLHTCSDMIERFGKFFWGFFSGAYEWSW